MRHAHHLATGDDRSKCDAFCLGRFDLNSLIAVSPAAYAAKAKVHHSKPRHHMVRRVPLPIDPNHPPVLMDQTPSYNDPSKFGGA